MDISSSFDMLMKRRQNFLHVCQFDVNNVDLRIVIAVDESCCWRVPSIVRSEGSEPMVLSAASRIRRLAFARTRHEQQIRREVFVTRYELAVDTECDGPG